MHLHSVARGLSAVQNSRSASMLGWNLPSTASPTPPETGTQSSHRLLRSSPCAASIMISPPLSSVMCRCITPIDRPKRGRTGEEGSVSCSAAGGSSSFWLAFAWWGTGSGRFGSNRSGSLNTRLSRQPFSVAASRPTHDLIRLVEHLWLLTVILRHLRRSRMRRARVQRIWFISQRYRRYAHTEHTEHTEHTHRERPGESRRKGSKADPAADLSSCRLSTATFIVGCIIRTVL